MTAVRRAGRCFLLSLMFCALAVTARAEEPGFAIDAYEISGNTIFSRERLVPLLKDQTGPDKTAEDVEKARALIEKYYHDQGYPTVLVNIPEQSVEEGVVRLEVIESTIRRVRITGNRYFTMEKILKKMPGIQPGKILYVPDIQQQLAGVNQHPDLKVAPVLMPGKELGTIDVELKVKDKLPLHGELELNNRNTHDTTDLRLNGLLSYDNLWQREHSLAVQGQVSPEDTEEVRSLAGFYVMPPPWSEAQVLSLYGIWSDSDTAFGEGFEVIGKGWILGLRDVIPLPGYGNWFHNLSLGVDYKDFDDATGFDGGADVNETPVSYMPLLAAYTASLQDGTGLTHLTSSLTFCPRGLASDSEEFEEKRYQSGDNFVYVTLGLSREQRLPWQALLKLSVDGQLADQPLVSNEQYIAGGMESVHGYKESEAAGDNGVRGVAELVSPDMARVLGLWSPLSLNLRGFYEYASLTVKEPLPEQKAHEELEGVGAGLDGAVGAHLNFGVHWGLALRRTEQTDYGDQEVYFKVKLLF
jgi:hemolysin activation/secretion protein